MIKVLIFGATGMLGHKLYQILSREFDVIGTIRRGYKDISRYGFMEPTILVPRFDALVPNAVKQVIDSIRPDVVINCIGVIKALAEKVGITAATQLNAELPHEMYKVCGSNRIRFIHISTDCVFSGKKGDYKEDDLPDAEDIYDKIKAQGEVTGEGALTIRTSIIGRELLNSNGLLEQFVLKRGGQVEASANAMFNGFPTLHLSRIIADIIRDHQGLTGLYHISSEPIRLYNMLTLINNAFNLNITINKTDEPVENRCLDSTRFRKETGFSPPPWEQMVKELAEDAALYDRWR